MRVGNSRKIGECPYLNAPYRAQQEPIRRLSYFMRIHAYQLLIYHQTFLHQFFFLLALQPPLGVVLYSPLAGFSLLAYEVP